MSQSHAENRDIRQRAWTLCKRNYWRILGATALVALVTLLISIVSAFLGELGTVFAAILSLLLSPILDVGLLQYILHLWHEEPCGYDALFRHAHSLPRIWAISLLTSLASLGMTLALGLASLTIILVIPAALAAIYISIRLSIAQTAFLLHPERTAAQLIGDSWRATRGCVWRVFCNTFVLSLPLAVASALTNFILTEDSIPALIVSSLFSALFNGYILLGQVGLNELLLSRAE